MKIESAVLRIALSVLTLSLVRAPAADYFVSPQGSDSNPGTSAQPFRTITHAYSLAGPGVTIIAKPGVYTDYSSRWGLHLGASGTASNPIVLRSEVRGAAVIDGLNASDRNVAIYLDGSYNIVEGFEIRGGPKGGITVWGNFNQILDNEIHHNGNPASTSTNGQDGTYSSAGTHDNRYVGNFIHDNGRQGSNLDHGLYLCGANELIANNVLLRNAATGLQIAGYSTIRNMKICNNVVAYNGTSGVILWMALDGVDLKNNIIYQNGTYGINSWDAHGSGVVIDHNLLFGNGAGNYHLTRGGSDFSYTLGTVISTSPLFVDSTALGFDPHLSAGSPAIDSGLNLFSLFTTDMDGVARPNSGLWDLGAFQAGDTIAPVVALTAPAIDATVFGISVAVSASASDNVGVAGVQFKLDGSNLGAEDTSSPYTLNWDSTTATSGSHLLSAVARDAAGNQTASAAVPVVVLNNTSPTISIIGDVTISEDSSTTAIPFTIADLETSAGNLILSAGSSNPALIPASNIVFGGSGVIRTVTVTPAPDQNGSVLISVSVSDGSATASEGFTVTVNAVNDLPSITNISDTVINEDASTAALTFSITDVETPAANLVLSAASANTALVPGTGVVFGGSGSNRTVAVTPAPNQNGSVAITVSVSDGAATASEDFTVTVTPVNDAPTITGISDVSIDQDTSTGPLSFTVDDLETPAGNLVLGAISSNQALAPDSGIVIGGSGSTRTVTANPAAGQSGTATITVTASDGSLSASTSFVVTVIPPPSIALTSPADGASYTEPATIDLAASVDSNGHTISKVQFYQNTGLVGEDLTPPYTFTWNNAAAGNYTLSARAVFDGGSTAVSPSVSVAVSPSSPPSSSLTFASTSGAITAPFVVSGGAISQPKYTSLNNAGRASYEFAITSPGDYVVSAQVDAPDTSSNSYYVNIDAEPAAFTMTWDIPPTAGMETRTVSWRGGGNHETAEFAPKVFTLSAGTHQLIILGREGGCALGAITIARYDTSPPTVSLTSPADGAVVSGASVNLSADAADSVGMAGVQFKLDGANLGAEETAAPYELDWNTTVLADGWHTLGAVARDTAGNQAAATDISVLVNNSPVLSFDATSGTITAPFVVANGTVYQTSYTSVTAGGRAVYTFTIAQTGDYTVSALVNAPDTGANSYFINIDAEPTDPFMIWDIPITSGPQEETVSWRGNGTPDVNDFAPKVFTLASGSHQLVIRGREANCPLSTITIAPLAAAASSVAPASLARSENPRYPAAPETGTISIGDSQIAATLASLWRTPHGGMRLTWASQPGNRYRVVGKDSIDAPTWVELSGEITAIDTTTSWMDATAADSPRRFYLVRPTDGFETDPSSRK